LSIAAALMAASLSAAARMASLHEQAAQPPTAISEAAIRRSRTRVYARDKLKKTKHETSDSHSG
jgi:hypothetical protein